MKLTIGLNKFVKINHPTALTLGNFDGIHKGHQKIIKEMICAAKKNNLESAILTFEPHPLKILNPSFKEKLKIITLKEKIHLAEKLGVENFIIVKFNKNIANIEAEDFVKDILVKKINIKYLICGYDFIFGKNRKGDFALLQKLATKYNFSIMRVEENKNDENEIYSSSKIRELLKNGDIKKVNQYLGRNYTISGRVLKGDRRGRKIGFPTVNLRFNKDFVIPKFAVYSGLIKFADKIQDVIVNIGIRPTFSNKEEPILEAHILNFKGDLYGEKVAIELIDFIRAEKKFNNIVDLQDQIKKDLLKMEQIKLEKY